MSYTGDDGRDVHFRLMDQLKPHWRRLAIALKFSQYEIATMESKDDPVYYMLTEWLRGANKEKDSRPASWRTLIEVLRQANVQEQAIVLEEKLIFGLKAASRSEFSAVRNVEYPLDTTMLMRHPIAVSFAGHGPDESDRSDPVEIALPPPGKPYASNVTHNSITLQWSESDQGASIVLCYTILYRKYADDGVRWTVFQTYNAQQKATLSNLEPKTAYVFKLRAEFAAGASPYSELSDPIETLLPISQPGKPTATDVTHNCITLQWTKPKNGSRNVRRYKILCRDSRSGIDDYIAINASRARGYKPKEVLKIPNLAPNTEYFFKVTAESNTGVSSDSEVSDPVRTQVPISQPGKPFATKVTHDSVTLKWEKPEQGAQNLKHYQVIYYSTDDSDNVAYRIAKAEEITLPNLVPKSTYIFKVKAKTVAGFFSESEGSDPIKTLLSPPGKPYATNITYKSFIVNWQKPTSYGSILYYSISYQTTNDPLDMWHTMTTEGDITHSPFSAASGNFYVFKVSAVTSAGVSSDSELSDPIETLAEPWGVKLYRSLQPIPNSNPPTYLLPTHCVMQKNDIVKVHVGANSQRKTRKGVHTSCSCHTRTAGVRHKVLLVVGATGAGKTTLINGMANYIMGVQWDDEFRFKLIVESSQDQSKSQTKCITAYTFYKESGSSLPYTLTVIDTPGFGDTGGLTRDKEIVSQIKELFSIAGDEGIDQLHGIGFVTQAPLARLTPTQQYVFDAILSVFGKNVADNIFLMITFADGMKPPVLDAVKAAGVPNKAFFKFNNSALFASKSADDEFDRMFWKMGTKSFDEFFNQFSNAQAQSLQLSREVIQERETLEVTIQGLQPRIQLGLSKIDELRQEKQMLNDHEADILTNKDFTYRVEITKQRMVKLSSGTYTTNCLTCNYTCHDDCAYADDDDKYKCSAMQSGSGTQNAVCGNCPGKCSWKMHKNTPYRFELYQDYETRTSDELKTRYESAMSSKEQLECVIEHIEKELDTMNMAVLRKIEQARRSIQRLQEIALKPNYLTEVEYIDLIIETEKREAKPRWMERVQALKDVRQQAEIVAELMKNPEAQQQNVFSIEETAQEKSMWLNFLHKIGAKSE